MRAVAWWESPWEWSAELSCPKLSPAACKAAFSAGPLSQWSWEHSAAKMREAGEVLIVSHFQHMYTFRTKASPSVQSPVAITRAYGAQALPDFPP